MATATKIGPTAAQYVTLKGGIVSVRVLLGNTAPVLTGGFGSGGAGSGSGGGGWNLVSRPRRKAITQWDGGFPFELTFSVIFDGIHDGSGSVEDAIAKLEQLALSPGPNKQPPKLAVSGALPHSDLPWVIEDLQWDTSPLRNAKGNRIRQECTIILLQYVATADLSTARARAAAAASPSTATSTSTTRATPRYTVKKGDTLQTIAAAQLGTASAWTDIATLNGIRDPRLLKAGQKLRLP